MVSCCTDFEAAFSAFSVDEEGSFLLLLVGTDFEVLKRANPYSSTDFLGMEIEAEIWDYWGMQVISLSCKCIVVADISFMKLIKYLSLFGFPHIGVFHGICLNF